VGAAPTSTHTVLALATLFEAAPTGSVELAKTTPVLGSTTTLALVILGL